MGRWLGGANNPATGAGFRYPTTLDNNRAGSGLPGERLVPTTKAKAAAVARTGRRESNPQQLLDFDGAADFFDLLLDCFALIHGDAFFERLGSRFHQILGFFQAQTGDHTHNLDDLDLL